MNYENDFSLRHWRKEYLDAVKNARSYEEMGEIAIEHLREMPQPISQVCGPISTGGHNDVGQNLEVFDATIRKLMLNGENVFNQMPFEWPMQKLRMKSPLSKDETNNALLNRFYLPVFNSGLISRLYFIHGWEDSHGSKWEHGKANELGLGIEYLPKDYHLDFQ